MESLITGKVWGRLTAAARQNAHKSYVAVAYFGANGADLLPLRKGSWLAVNASEVAVKRPIYRGSILDADPPAQGVNIASRMTRFVSP